MESKTKYKTDIKMRCFKFSLDVIELSNAMPSKRSAWIISDQLIRSATSIGATLTEAKASSSRLEYKKFYEIALKSANESVYWLELLRESNLSSEKQINPLLQEVTEICKMLGAGVIKLKSRQL